MEKIYTVEEVAEHLKVCTKTIRDWIWDGKLLAFRVGTVWRIRESELEKVMNAK